MPIVKAKSIKIAKKNLKSKYGKDILLSKVHVMKSANAPDGLKWYGTNWSETGKKNRVYQR